MLPSIAKSPIKGVTILASSTPVRAPDFTGGVREAIKAYAKTGQMQAAALAYVAHGVPVFPVRAGNKNPIPPKLRDENGKPIPGTGGHLRATCDPDQIREWWKPSQTKKHSEHLIGVPMGPLSGVWAVDIDTKEGGHSNEGFTGWNALLAEHGKIKTRQHQSASGSIHEIFRWSERNPNQSGDLPKGIDVKSHGGFIIVPPSQARIKNRKYVVTRDIKTVEAPAWLTDIIGTASTARTAIHRDPAKPLNPFQEFGATVLAKHGNKNPLADIAELREAMPFVANHDKCDWDEWVSIGLAIHAATGGSDDGFALFDDFSKRAVDPTLYNAKNTRERWYVKFRSSGPSRTGAAKLFKIATANGWKTAPTHAPAQFTAIESAREEIARIINRFMFRSSNRNAYQLFGDEALGSAMLLALRIDPGIGKTTIAISELAKSGLCLIHYAVPTHKLAVEIVNRLGDLGVNARALYGREADDPELPGKAMCQALDKVKIAVNAKMDVTKSCCKNGKDVCAFHEKCGYQRQGRDTEDVRVWVFASDYLFHRTPALGTPDLLILDESFWQKQLRGIDDDERSPILLASLNLDPAMETIRDGLKEQPNTGPVQLEYAECEGDSTRAHDEAIRSAWKSIEESTKEVEMRPSMSTSQFKAHIKSNRDKLKRIGFYHSIIKALEELRQMVKQQVRVSGRLHIVEVEENGSLSRGIQWRGVAKIKKQFRVPTLALDATLPSEDILRVSHPRVTIGADIRVPFPNSVHNRQITGAPTSKSKLVTGDSAPKRQEDVLRFIQQEWIRTGRQKALVIAQMDYEEYLRERLPEQIAIAHYNNIAGLDEHKDVRLLILIGRPMPGPEAVETIAGTLSGIMPDCVEDDEDGGFTWYPQIKRGIRLRDGSGVAVRGDQHPDPLCEDVRQQITEAELLQALGRARAVNRDASTPLDVVMLFDCVLPIEVDDHDIWERPSLFISIAIHGVMLTSKTDLMKVWPELFSDKNVADRTIAKGVPTLPRFEIVRYRPAGPKMKWRVGYFDRAVIPDPVAWLVERLGPVQVDR